MKILKTYMPWAFVIILTIALVIVLYSSKKSLQERDDEISDLQLKYGQLVAYSNETLAEANKKLAEANSQNKRLAEESSQKAGEMESKLQQASLPEAPVLVSFRKALISNGYVARIVSISRDTIALEATFMRPSGKNKSTQITLDSGAVKEIGELEGWAFVPGDTVTITIPAHKPKTYTLN